jgi:hypothetical protein
MSASPAPGTTCDTASFNPAASAATSADAGVAVYQTAFLAASHCRASVVLPYPAGAISICTRALDWSSKANRRGRSMILRLRSRTSGVVAVVAYSLPDVSWIDARP